MEVNWSFSSYVVTGYIGEGIYREQAWLWGLISGIAYFYIVYLVWFGEVAECAKSAGGAVAKANSALAKFVLIGWAIYPIGYMAGTPDGTVLKDKSSEWILLWM